MTPSSCTSRRNALGWTKAELARRARIAPTTVKHYEAGRNPTLGKWWVDSIDRALSEGERLQSPAREGQGALL